MCNTGTIPHEHIREDKIINFAIFIMYIHMVELVHVYTHSTRPGPVLGTRGAGAWARDRYNTGTTVCTHREPEETFINRVGDL